MHCSENDDIEIKQHKLKICPYFPCVEPEDNGDIDDIGGFYLNSDDPTLIFTQQHTSGGQDSFYVPKQQRKLMKIKKQLNREEAANKYK